MKTVISKKIGDDTNDAFISTLQNAEVTVIADSNLDSLQVN
jgi:hypothetical protein